MKTVTIATKPLAGRRGASGAEALLHTNGNTVNRVLPESAGKGKKGPRIDRARYEAMKAALLAVVPRDEDGVTFASLPKLVEKRLGGDVFAGASIPWYVATVKLDLEARGLLERIPGKAPQRLRRL